MPLAWLRRLATEARDVCELVMLPGLAACLPWSWCFTLFKRMARWHWLYRETSEAALQQALARGWAGTNHAHWLWARKLTTLTDHADHYLGVWRSDAWLKRHVEVRGQWPKNTQRLLLVTFHWGAGYWGLRHAAAHGIHPHALVASLATPSYQGRSVLTHYARARNANVARTLGAPVLDVRHNLKGVVRAARQGQPLLGVLDVPAEDAKAAIEVALLGMQASFPTGLLRLAVEQQLPVVIYVTGLNTQTGGRTLDITPLGCSPSVAELADTVFSELQKLIAQDAPAWHFWAEAPRIFKSLQKLE